MTGFDFTASLGLLGFGTEIRILALYFELPTFLIESLIKDSKRHLALFSKILSSSAVT